MTRRQLATLEYLERHGMSTVRQIADAVDGHGADLRVWIAPIHGLALRGLTFESDSTTLARRFVALSPGGVTALGEIRARQDAASRETPRLW